MNSQTTQQLYKATIAHFIAQKERATATLHLYFTNSVAIGDHANVLEEIVKLTKDLCEAEECIVALEKTFMKAGAPQPQVTPVVPGS
jgi:methylaspartate ammonia-lyase